MKKNLTVYFLLISFFCQAQTSVLWVDSLLQEFNIPEISYAVFDANRVLEIEALGKHAIHLPDKATLHDRFHLGSNTKAMTAFMIAKYVEKGKLKWSTKFFDLFPEWKRTSQPGYYEITLEELLSHRAHIQAFQGVGDTILPIFSGDKQRRRRDFGRFVLTLQPVPTDSVHPFQYSNAGYTLAALMLEQVTHKTWEQLADEIFNHDLKLNIAFSWPENQQVKDTWGHSFEEGRWVPVSSDTSYHLDYTEPAGDINIRLNDYVRFIQYYLQGLQGEGHYLRATTYHYLLKGVPNYSLGWYNIFEKGIEFSTHAGTAGTYYSLVHIDRTRGLGYIILSNSFSDHTQQAVRLLMRKLKMTYEGKGTKKS